MDPLLPEPVADMLGDYRALLAGHGMTWGEPLLAYVAFMPYQRFLPDTGPLWQRVMAVLPAGAADDLDEAVAALPLDALFRDVLDGALPYGLHALRLTPQGARAEGAPRAVLDTRPLPLTLLVDSSLDTAAVVEVGGARHEIPPRGARLLDTDTSARLTVDGAEVAAGFTRRAARASLRLRAGFPCRWTVVGAGGQGYRPDGVRERRDAHGLPYFHGDDLVLPVPAEPLTVRVARGMEYGTAEVAVHPEPGRETLVELRPERLYDAPARGWYGGDLHVHLNWAGDLVALPAEAGAQQLGEDLHVLNLVAGNVSGPRVYDREALEHWAGRDLPWSDATHVARMGVEHRSDLLGHVHAFGLTAPPALYHSGFAGDHDWPPPSTACRELRALGATLGYAHSFHTPIGDDAPAVAVMGTRSRECSARAIVIDAALGLVDGIEILHFSSALGTAAVYRRLLGAGNRLAALAGSDTKISFSRQQLCSSPPGWVRVYAQVEGALDAESYKDALRAGRTFVTTGPWLELSVDGAGPGETLDVRPGTVVRARARVVGPEVETLEIRTADGVVATGASDELSVELAVEEPTYVVAVALGGPHPRSLYRHVYAHTSPVHLDVESRRTARPQDVRWCLAWLDHLEELIRKRGRFSADGQLHDHLDLLDQARAVYRARL
ncbi:hypothetical protein Ssi02_39380 [Sinosporangium siamense]|uniref:Uncharacterized protein n=2 Tax=Sinosporangium siamense TaxID=1367973 RepID=A0A919V8X6_9ACTN|nr:hypothetical protein Ssi02_39380 [Sinosporangium siamense]